MGMLFRLIAPKPVKRARRTVRKAAHPVRTTRRAVTPKPVKKIERQVRNAANPLSFAELKAQDAAVGTLQRSRHRRRKPVNRDHQRQGAEERQARAQRVRTARGPWRWPEWVSVLSLACFVLGVIVAAAGIAALGGTVILLSLAGLVVAGPVAAWRWIKAYRRTVQGRS